MIRHLLTKIKALVGVVLEEQETNLPEPKDLTSSYLIQIDRNSMRINPNAGRTQYLVPGKSSPTFDKDGNKTGYSREMQTVYSMFPEPRYLYKYQDTLVSCYSCGALFDYGKLEDAHDSFNGEDYWNDEVCPECDQWDCCEIEYEEPEEAIKEFKRKQKQ